MAKEASSGEDRATALFNGVNFLLFAIIGGVCLLWPHISCCFHSSSQNKTNESGTEKKSNASAQGQVAADDNGDAKANAKALEAESLPKADAVKISINDGDTKPAKRQLVYLTSLKAFMTFQVVTVHTLDLFTFDHFLGLGTWSVDISNVKEADGGSLSLATFGQFIAQANQYYFMAAFYLISAYFCVKSLDRKGFRAFVVDKFVRLGGPFVLWSLLLGPLLELWNLAYAGLPLKYEYILGPPWFILWLLNFTLIYAVVAQVLPSLHFKMPHPLLLLVLGLGLGGAFYGLSLAIGSSLYSFLGDMMMWSFGLAIYVPFFVAGIAGGRNDWLRSVENMATWLVWCLRTIAVGFWVLLFLEIAQYTIPGLSSVHIDYGPFPDGGQSLSTLWIPIYSIAMTLAIMQLFHQYFNSSPQSKFMKSAGLAAYTVYVIHPWVANIFVLIFVQILKAANVPIVLYTVAGEGNISATKAGFLILDADGDYKFLPDAYLWGGWIFVFVLTQLVVWPLAHYFRKLPVMNKMF